MMLLAVVLAVATQKPVYEMSDADLEALVKTAHALPDEGQRMSLVSQRFLGTRYVLGPLGEGAGRDPDPLVRFDAVDCVTFVEEVLALTRADSLPEAKQVLQKIRYRGSKIAYEERNHFMEADWIPSNIRKGFVKDITRQVGGSDVIHDDRTLTLAEWHQRADCKEIDLPDDKAPVGTFHLAVLPMDKVALHAASIPTGTIVVVTHRSGPTQPNRISHVGLVVRDGDAVMVRHASSLKRKVIDEPLADFAARFQAASKPGWPVSGLAFVQPI